MVPADNLLYKAVCNEFSFIIAQLNAEPFVVGDNELVVVAPSVVLWLPTDRDGLHVWYVRRAASGVFKAYNLSGILANRCTGGIFVDIPQPRTWEAEIRAHAQAYARRLAAAGQDILAGDEKWIREYEATGGMPLPLPPAMAVDLQKLLPPKNSR